MKKAEEREKELIKSLKRALWQDEPVNEILKELRTIAEKRAGGKGLHIDRKSDIATEKGA